MALIEEVTEMGAGEVGELYGSFAERLEQIVRLDVRASDAVIEDACQVAWFRLLHHCQRVHRETVMAWLARTAVHEASRPLRRARRELPLDAAIETGEEPAISSPARRRTSSRTSESAYTRCAGSRSGSSASCGCMPSGLATPRWRHTKAARAGRSTASCCGRGPRSGTTREPAEACLPTSFGYASVILVEFFSR